MFKLGDKVTVNDGAIGYCHPDMQNEYTKRLNFHGKPPATVVKVPEKDDNSACIMVEFVIFPAPDNYFAFKSSDLTLDPENNEAKL